MISVLWFFFVFFFCSSSCCSCCCCRFGQNSYESKSVESLMFSKRTTRKTHGDRTHPYPFHSLISPENSVQFFNDCSGSSPLKQLKLMHLLVFWLILGSIPRRPTEAQKPAAEVRDLREAGGKKSLQSFGAECLHLVILNIVKRKPVIQTLKLLSPKIDQVLIAGSLISIFSVAFFNDLQQSISKETMLRHDINNNLASSTTGRKLLQLNSFSITKVEQTR